MLLNQEQIKDLLPHRMPFLFIDEILSADNEYIIGKKIFTEDDKIFSSFNGSVSNYLIIESLAQCGGAGARLLGDSKGLYALAQIEKAKFHIPVKFNQELCYKISNVRVSDKLIKQSGKAYFNDLLVLEADWICVKLS